MECVSAAEGVLATEHEDVAQRTQSWLNQPCSLVTDWANVLELSGDQQTTKAVHCIKR